MSSINRFLKVVALALLGVAGVCAEEGPDYLAAKWDPLHFQPAIAQATDAQCLECHANILEDRPLASSPAGVQAADALAWYQTISTYQGDQETFHRRHMVTPLAKQLMDMKCNTCHQGHNPREQAIVPPSTSDTSHTLRKSINPDTCLMCHGKFPYTVMGLPGDWESASAAFGDNCLLCHAAIRTTRHQVNYLKPEAIEAAAKENNEVCYGCHGARSWYRISYPYARNPWPGMATEVPAWAKDRPTSSHPRFLNPQDSASN